ncbi:MAG TPA: DUF2269 family protein [Candidatus Dormibacteraeota bacterium]
MNWFLFWLFLHILAAVIAFGPIFVFPIVGSLAAQMPQHMHFAVALNHRIEQRLVLPLALSMAVSGVGLIWTANINIFQTPFLFVGVGLYLVALVIALTALLPMTTRLVHLVEHAPPPAVPGPPPHEMMQLVRRLQMFGGITTVLFLVIIFLMVIQPGGITLR